MKVQLSVDMDNDAFGIDPAYELKKIFGKLNAVVKEECLLPGDGGKVMDVNGNSVATWEVTA